MEHSPNFEKPAAGNPFEAAVRALLGRLPEGLRTAVADCARHAYQKELDLRARIATSPSTAGLPKELHERMVRNIAENAAISEAHYATFAPWHTLRSDEDLAAVAAVMQRDQAVFAGTLMAREGALPRYIEGKRNELASTYVARLRDTLRTERITEIGVDARVIEPHRQAELAESLGVGAMFVHILDTEQARKHSLFAATAPAAGAVAVKPPKPARPSPFAPTP